MPAPVEIIISGLRVETIPMLHDYAQPLLPEIIQIVSIASADIMSLVAAGKVDLKKDVADPAIILAIMPSLRNLAEHLEGRLEKLAAKLLVTTRVAMPIHTGEIEWHDLSNPKDRSAVFNEHPEMYFPVLLHAGRTTFGRFFPASARKEKGPPAE